MPPSLSSFPPSGTVSRNPIIREFHSLQRRGKKILKITGSGLRHRSPHVEIHVDDGGPPYPVSVGNFHERDRLLSEAAGHLPESLPIAV